MATTPEHCSNCGAPLQPGAVFCSQCGTRVAVARPDILSQGGERRRITVLFSDLVDSTPLGARLDPEDLRDVVDAYYRVCGDAIRQYGGHIGNYLGDGILAYFGYPVAHEDSASRAVRAGLAMQEAVARWNEEDGPTFGEQIATRIGIHTGLAVLDDMGGEGRREVHAMGDAVNVASRVESSARPGTVFVTDETSNLIEGEFELVSQGRFDLKGVSADMALYEVAGISSAAAPITGGRGPFVGRAAERAQLAGLWSEVSTQDRGHVVLVSGEAGIGKSRLLEEAHAEIGTGVPWFQTSCSSYGRLTPFAAMEGLLRSVFDAPGDRSPMQLLADSLNRPGDAALIANLLALDSGPEPMPALTPVETRTRIIHAIADLLTAAAGRDCPGVLLVEDLHWADASSLETIALIANRLRSTDAPDTLLVLTARPDFVPSWEPGDSQTTIQLERLSSAEIDTLIRHELNAPDVDSTVVAAIVERTDGVPLFAEELARAVTEPSADAVPATLSDSLLARLDRLDHARRVAQLAAVVGRQFDGETLGAVIGDATDLESDLTELQSARIIRPLGRGRFEFQHALVQEAAYESLLFRSRRELHERVATVLARRPTTLPEVLARHWTAAGEHGRAVASWRDAATRARQQAAFVEAVSHLTRAIAALGELPDSQDRSEDELELQYMLANSLQFTEGFGSDAANAAMARARELSDRLGDADQQVAAIYGLYTTTLSSGDIVASGAMAEQLWRIANASGDIGHLRTARIALASSALNTARFREGLEHATAALGLRGGTAQIGENFDDVNARLYGSLCAAYLGDEESLSAIADPLFERAAKSQNDPLTDVISVAFALIVHQFLADYDDAVALADELSGQAGGLGLSFLETFADMYGGWAETMRSGDPAGLQRLRRGFENQLAAQQNLNLEHSLSILAECLLKLGEIDEGLATADRAVAAAVHPHHHWEARRVRAMLMAEAGRDAQDVADEFVASAREARRHDSVTGELCTRLSHAQWLHRMGDREQARRVLPVELAATLSDRILIARQTRELAELLQD